MTPSHVAFIAHSEAVRLAPSLLADALIGSLERLGAAIAIDDRRAGHMQERIAELEKKLAAVTRLSASTGAAEVATPPAASTPVDAGAIPAAVPLALVVAIDSATAVPPGGEL